MVKRLLGAVLVVVCMLSAGMLVQNADAAQNVNAYIVLRCTVTLSVTLVDGASSYAFNDISAATTGYSQSAITVRNNSQGAICKWDLNVDAASLSGWSLGTAPGLNTAALFGLFKPTQDNSAFEVVADTISTTVKEYNATNFYHADYETEGYSNDASKILPQSCAAALSKSPDRNLWLKLQTPLAVTDQTSRTLILTVTARMAS